jgi:hypothetical protein
MIELPKHEDEWAYYESEPLFDYVTRVSDMMGEIVTDINPDGSHESTPHLLPFSFASAYHENKIDLKGVNLEVYEKSEIQDTLKAFGLDSSKFWYLCLFIKWKVDWEFNSAMTFPKEPLEKLKDLQAEFEKLDFTKVRGKYVSSKTAELTFKVKGSKAYTIDDKETLAILNNIINGYLLTTPTKGYLLHDSQKVDLSIATKMYLFNKYLTWFIAPLKADSKIHACKDKSLLISRMLYILGVYDHDGVDEEGNEGHENKKHKMNKENLWEEYSGNGNKKNYLKGILSKYNHPRYWHF